MAMNKYLLSCFFMAISCCANSQLQRLLVQPIDTSVYGVTYRVYAEVKSAGDQIMVVFGDNENPLRITSTEPFFQSEAGGALSTQVRKNQLETAPDLTYDSWLTIGREDNYNNQTKSLGLRLTAFEEKGESIEVNDGAWYCLPTDKQSFADDSKKILLMQLTTKGEVSGTLSLFGRSAGGENFELRSIQFSGK
jgi:hypothetical protein